MLLSVLVQVVGDRLAPALGVTPRSGISVFGVDRLRVVDPAGDVLGRVRQRAGDDAAVPEALRGTGRPAPSAPATPAIWWQPPQPNALDQLLPRVRIAAGVDAARPPQPDGDEHEAAAANTIATESSSSCRRARVEGDERDRAEHDRLEEDERRERSGCSEERDPSGGLRLARRGRAVQLTSPAIPARPATANAPMLIAQRIAVGSPSTGPSPVAVEHAASSRA